MGVSDDEHACQLVLQHACQLVLQHACQSVLQHACLLRHFQPGSAASLQVPREPLMLVIRAFGGEVAYDGEGSLNKESDEAITHQVRSSAEGMLQMRLLHCMSSGTSQHAPVSVHGLPISLLPVLGLHAVCSP
jgi:hypothetical protein